MGRTRRYQSPLRQPRPHHLVVRLPRPEHRNGLNAADLVKSHDAAEASHHQQRVGVAERDILGGEESTKSTLGFPAETPHKDIALTIR